MKLGATMFPTTYTIRPDVLGRAREERGFESLFVTDHTHIPVSRGTPFLFGPELSYEYIHVLDPFDGVHADGFPTAFAPYKKRSESATVIHRPL
jgi:alkanesulfonate monooxygenase SsuD/methylene tetrahydromethanopterin reductase-like flavin-dependent oxidoreductase (luciferase family)